MRRLALAGLASFALAACDHGAPAPRSGATIAPITVGADRAPQSIPEGWTPWSSARYGVRLAYPAGTFGLHEKSEGVRFESGLSREGLGDDPGDVHVYGFTLSRRAGAPRAVLERDFASFARDAFVKGVFHETESIAAANLAGKPGYKLVMGVEGYDSIVYVVAQGEGSLVIELRIVGDVMAPEIPAEKQLATLEQVVHTIEID